MSAKVYPSAGRPSTSGQDHGYRTSFGSIRREILLSIGRGFWHAVESAVGAHLLATARTEGIEVLYWNVGIKEVDYVLRKGERLAAIEVKSAQADSVSGMKEFRAKNPEAKIYLIGGQGMPLETFFTLGAPDFL